jgi:DNA polymerase-3 subunit epsilon
LQHTGPDPNRIGALSLMAANRHTGAVQVREIVLDTETTGLDHKAGDRLIELGCVEIVNRFPTGRELHFFFNPEGREVHPEAEAIHGISAAFLIDKPMFHAKVDEFMDFIGDAPLVIHNATFDIGFINAELARIGRGRIGNERVIDTLALARRKHPAGPNSLDALCRRHGIDNSQRTKHGAITDSLLLAAVYVELLGERQTSLVLATHQEEASQASRGTGAPARARPAPLPARLSDDQIAAHAEFIGQLGPNAIWRRYLEDGADATAPGMPKAAVS